jgi:hypothetical protein
MRILMIHGRAQGGKDPENLRAEWIRTLEEGFESAGAPFPKNVKFDFPFYADRLDRFTAQANLPTPHEVVAKGQGKNLEFEQFMQSALDEMKNRSAISDAEVLAEMGKGSTQEKGIQNWEWVQAIVGAIDRKFPAAADFSIECFLKDVFLYVNKLAIAREVNKIIEEKLTTEPTIVIGHSLGSVVGYKVILENPAKLNLIKYITVGCPLGITVISSKLGLLQNAGGRKGWYNAYDTRDIVALNPLDNRYFPTNPAIVNYDGVHNQTSNRHGIVGYLNDAHVAQQVAESLV